MIVEAVTMGSVNRPRSPVPCRTALPTSAAPAGTALIHAEAAFREALRAAAEYAVARAAGDIGEAELMRTRRRVRALRRHWTPRLESALARVELALEQAEHEDVVRRRRAARTREGGRGGGE
ncbi:V-type ATP synthase subunit D [Streptomyces pratens]|uniref:V-type ATP synthase subunit D n=1 Tax=Streptomyces pratens TaxID=887456 RepID=A0ABW1M0Z0_9ACTN